MDTENKEIIEFDVILSDSLSKPYNPRFVVVEKNTGKVLDDAQGYGYKTKQGAYKAWTFKRNAGNPKKYKDNQKKKALDFIKSHKELCREICDMSFYALKDGGEGLSDAEIMDFLKEHGVDKLPVSLKTLFKYM